MDSIYNLNGQEAVDSPLLLFECTLISGAVERWSTHGVRWAGEDYEPVLLRHNSFELRTAGEDGIDGVPRISITLANADYRFSEIERATGWKGAKLTVRFVLYDLARNSPTSEARVVFKGVADSPEEITEATLRLSFSNRLNLRRSELPQLRIQRHCPWMFPKDNAQRAEAVSGGDQGRYSVFYSCGYSPDQADGCGNAPGGSIYTMCEYTRSSCIERGMFDRDVRGTATRRFGGIEFVPSSILVRTNGEKALHAAAVLENEAKYNDVVPLVYGTAWLQPPLILARNDGNLTHSEVLLSANAITRVLKVIVNNVEIPEAVAKDMSSTGWFRLVSTGQRDGTFNPDFADNSGRPTGDPYGGMSVLSIVVPNRVNDGTAQPRIQVLVEGIKLPQFDDAGALREEAFSSNPAWVLLDILRRSGWVTHELDLASFANSAAYCDEELTTSDTDGRTVNIPRSRCNLVVRRRMGTAELVRSIRKGAGLLLRFSDDGRLEVVPETTLAKQQPAKPACSNAAEQLNGGWPAYEFGDGTSGFGAILRRGDGASTLRIWSRSAADTPNRFTVDFQDEFNGYQQDSLSVVEPEDVLTSGQETTASLAAAGVSNFNQAGRVIKTHLQRSVYGNTYIDFETGIRGFGIKPGDIITLTYLNQGFYRQPFRVLRVAPGSNYRTAAVTAQLHEDSWYADDGTLGGGAGRESARGLGIPRPITGIAIDENGDTVLGISEEGYENADGSYGLRLKVEFRTPQPPARNLPAPLLSLAADVSSTGGSLRSGATYYYGVSAVDDSGFEGPLSFLVRADVPDGSDTAQVTLRDLTFPEAATSFHVYRGTNPIQLARIAAAVRLAGIFVDGGVAVSEGAPTDPNYDHTNLYWRHEVAPKMTVASADTHSVATDAMRVLVNEHSGYTIRMLSGAAKGHERVIASNTENTWLTSQPWTVIPSPGDEFCVTESGWKLGSVVAGTPATIDVPNREGAVVQVCGRAANVENREAAYEFSPVTRWRIGGSAADANVPSEPVFALSSSTRGTFEIAGIAFADLTNTRTITAGTVSVHYFDEIEGERSGRLITGVDETVLAIKLSGASAVIGSCIQIGREVLRIVGKGEEDDDYEVERGAYGSSAEPHDVSEVVYPLKRRIYTLSFPRDFFGSPASGSYAHELPLRNARIAFAEMSVMNCRGNSQAYAACVTGVEERGLRTLSGGQFSLQVDGYLAIQSNAVPPVTIDGEYSVRQVEASVGFAPTKYDIQVRVNRNGEPYADLTIPAGQTRSVVIDGFPLGPLLTGDVLTLDILSVGQDVASSPGRDLTVSVRV